MYKFQVFGFGQGLLEGMCTLEGVRNAVEFIAANWSLSITTHDLQILPNGCLHVHAFTQAVDVYDGIDISFEPVIGHQETCRDGINPNWAKGQRMLHNAQCILWLPALVNGVDAGPNAWMIIG